MIDERRMSLTSFACEIMSAKEKQAAAKQALSAERA
jgi:hypothetical protein